jgi:N-acetylglucosaminyldiphosphoundecaprenol N-acetyl-beta-D-mannosaminyltransferase
MSQTYPQILKIKITGTSKMGVIDFVTAKLKAKQKFFIVTPNPEILVEAQKNPSFASALNSADLSLPDGVGLVLAAKVFGLKNIQRIAGRQMMLKLLEFADHKKLHVFFLGSTKLIIKSALHQAKINYPNIKIMTHSGPQLDKTALPVSEIDRKIEIDAVNQINSFKPDLLFVAFGAPKQELWLAKHLAHLKIGGVMVVGGSLDYFAGAKRLPPSWLSSFGFEWLWRLFQEKGHFKRVFTAVVIFPFYVIKEKLTS